MSTEQPARARLRRTTSAGDEQPPRTGRRASLLGVLWVLLAAAATAALGWSYAVDADVRVDQVAATALAVLLALGLTARTGGPITLAGLVAAAVGGTAVAAEWPPLLGGAALATGVLAACLAVVATVPARGPVAVVREVVLAHLIAAAGALAVRAYAVELDAARFAYTVLGLALVATIALVYRLGGGLHGLGRSGLFLLVAAVGLLVVALAYSVALTRYGPVEVTEQVDAAAVWAREHLGAAPHPIGVLVGVPALAWGVSMRDRRRQGWWVCAFGATSTATVTARLIEPGTLTEVGLGAAYTLGLGLLLGFLVIGLARLLGRRGRRTPWGAHRPEPSRLRALH